MDSLQVVSIKNILKANGKEMTLSQIHDLNISTIYALNLI